ncbi:hypothetical protein [Bacteriovorax sp. DB6_IX]|uniref:hypothetical protein n=1 Tax=Bacteriovorax sp. DB6_IX TaxID=1353530 RepID=UPI0018E02A94|nr:hypothetical protein [Bacteriovorax sp. DB6_IX]
MKIFTSLTFITIAALLTSCVPDSSGGRQKFTSSASATTCTESFFLYTDGTSCATTCPTGTHEGTSDEVAAILADATVSDEIKEIVQTSKGVCIDDPTIESRPSGEIYINSDFCVCKNAKVASVNASTSCTSTCAEKNVTVATIFGSVSVSSVISGNENLKNLHGWCNNDLDNEAQNPASCSLVATDMNGASANINITTSANSNSFSATLEGNISFDKTYKLQIVETGTGVENATTSIEQVRLLEPETDDGLDLDGNLRIKLVGQYTCFFRTIQTDNNTNDDYYLGTARYHFYLPSDASITPLSPGLYSTIFCHDYVKEQDTNDKAKYSRLEFIPDQYALWDTLDPRFIKSGNNLSVDFLIQEKIEQFGVSDPPLKSYFSELNGCTSPDSSGSGCISQVLGIAMSPFIDSKGKSFCPGTDEYLGTNPEMRALGEIIGVPTEGIYYAEGPREVQTLPDGSQQELSNDVIMVREGVLKKIWFHLGNNGVPVTPTEQTENQATYFYWPADFASPYVQKKGYQKLYTVKRIGELLNQGRTTEIPTSLTPHDRKAACVPASSD